MEAHHDHGSHHPPAADGECAPGHLMTFHLGVCQEILFSGWVTTNAMQLFGSAVALFVAGFLYEGLKYYRQAAQHGASSSNKDSQVNITKTECGGADGPRCHSQVKYGMFSSPHVVQTLLHIIQTTISYILMLVFMTYNVWLCLALVLGMGLGYFVFGWRRAGGGDTNDCCS
ncbi:unnamed protein product [Plutella xylostella]|uniref:Copper transport protein n=1 Tax=Plutella xylostella TaxID=51655 RepID=A0A8S4FKW7_PLUXY|nr:unnamed protein product [Plutella xylostella]